MNNQKHTLGLGKIRMSPLMFGSLRFIASRHANGALNIDEIRQLKQTQLRSFKTHEWISETGDRTGITITKKGKAALRSFEDNDEFFRNAASMSFTSLLNLRLPDEEPARIQPVAEINKRRSSASAA